MDSLLITLKFTTHSVPIMMILLWWIFHSVLTTTLFSCFSSNAELITALPGQPSNVSFKQYSGYIVTNAQHGRALFYYFVEADSTKPHSHPLTIWLNGGPGCSSLGFGAFQEHGPFQPGKDGQLIKNEYSWNKESGMLYIESPVGVGFSYSNTSSDYVGWGDIDTAQENLQFILNWFKEFPQYRRSDLYITGESYAGHYVPQFAAQILDYNKHPRVQPINLKGIALGNPVLDFEISFQSAEFLWSHGVISDELLMLKNSVCNDTRLLSETVVHKNVSKECLDVAEKQKEEMGIDTDTGDLLLPSCLSNVASGQLFLEGLQHINNAERSSKMKSRDPCIYDRIDEYLNNPRVQVALHANTTSLPYAWEFCTSGDQDSKIPLTQTRIIANMLAKDLKLIPFTRYSPWYSKKQIAGWTQSFGRPNRGKNVTYLTFATVRGAAHEVPFTSPAQALTLFQYFLKRSPLPKNAVGST